MSTNIKIAIAAAALAIAAIIATVLIVNGGGGSSGAYVTEVVGNVYVDSNDNGRAKLSAGDRLSKLEIITVEGGGSCTVTYQTSKKKDNNFVILGEYTQAIISGDFSGGKPSEINLIQGTASVNNASSEKGFIRLRTANGLFEMDNTAAAVIYNAYDSQNYTQCWNMLNKMHIQLYDAAGNTVDKNLALLPQTTAKALLLNTTSQFDTLNYEFALSDIPTAALKGLYKISAFVTLPYSAAEIQAVIDEKETEDTTDVPDSSESIQTADTFTTTDVVSVTMPETVTTEPPRETVDDIQVISSASVIQTSAAITTTTQAPATTSPTTTATSAPQTTESSAPSTGKKTYTVTFDIDGMRTAQEVEEGGNAVFPENPTKTGYLFTGWDNAGTNITSDITINALFEAKELTVTLVIGSESRTQLVPYGGNAEIPSDIILDGIVITGWDRPLTNITEDCTITALLEGGETSAAECVVTFSIDGTLYTQRIPYGTSAVPPLTPDRNSAGQIFVGWSRSLDNITSDVTITAVFDNENTVYTVTIDNGGQLTTTQVYAGSSVTLPVPREIEGKTFSHWDNSGENIHSNITITAIYV